LDKLEQLKHELYSKYRLVEEERRHFVFKLDTRDEQEMLEQKEKEDKKKQKLAKKPLLSFVYPRSLDSLSVSIFLMKLAVSGIGAILCV
jgi:hypothetical protein